MDTWVLILVSAVLVVIIIAVAIRSLRKDN